MDDSNKSNEPLAVMFIDLDRFKEINDTYGHAIGDLVIKTVAARISQVVEDNGVVCRLGGDEFAILIPSPAHRDLTFDIASRILKETIKPIEVAGNESYLTCSIGVAFSDKEQNNNPQALLKNADAAMYRAKELGRNRVFYSEDTIQPVRIVEGWSLSDLHRALAQDEISVSYQPIVHMSTGYVIGFEALARWQHPKRGIISPDEFIPLAEDNGLIVELGDIIIRKSFAQLRRWNDEADKKEKQRVQLSINLSLRQLNEENFLEKLNSYCEDFGVDSTCINFEMTESSLLGDARNAISILTEMKNLGFGLFIDDFGTGYSSLSYLKKFPITGFKIDRSFVQGYGHDENDTAIVNALVSLASSMHLVVTAEGVQSITTRNTLREMGCTYGQGYFYSEPLKAEEIDLSDLEPLNQPARSRHSNTA